MRVDERSVTRMIENAVDCGMHGLFLAGTCGEGPWLPDRERRRLVDAACAAAKGRLEIAIQVSDTSVPRILDNIELAASAGVKYVVIALPTMMMNVTPNRIVALFEQVALASPLPLGIYDLGDRRAYSIPAERLRDVYLLPNVHFIKDSSACPARREIALAARAEKTGLRLFNGNEFQCIDYLNAGYDGTIFGGAVAVSTHLRRIFDFHEAGNPTQAAEVDAEMKRILYGIYGGESLTCWLTGLKHYMVCRGLFESTASFLEYPLTEECRAFIEHYVNTERLVDNRNRVKED